MALKSLKLVNICSDKKLSYYWDFPITTYFELESIINLGVCELFLGMPLSFDLKYCKNTYNLPIRLVPNLAFDAYIPRGNGVRGFYIRPEDIDTYAEYVDYLEFVTDDLEKERTLLHIYKDNKQWPGNLNLLITNLNQDIDNRALPEEFGITRMNCKQKCTSGGACRFCTSAFIFADEIRIEAKNRNKKISN